MTQKKKNRVKKNLIKSIITSCTFDKSDYNNIKNSVDEKFSLELKPYLKKK